PKRLGAQQSPAGGPKAPHRVQEAGSGAGQVWNGDAKPLLQFGAVAPHQFVEISLDDSDKAEVRQGRTAARVHAARGKPGRALPRAHVQQRLSARLPDAQKVGVVLLVEAQHVKSLDQLLNGLGTTVLEQSDDAVAHPVVAAGVSDEAGLVCRILPTVAKNQ